MLHRCMTSLAGAFVWLRAPPNCTKHRLAQCSNFCTAGASLSNTSPILNHPVHQPSAFTARRLMEDVRRSRRIPPGTVPALCILEFDGDLTDSLERTGLARPYEPWACFHTTMFALYHAGIRC